MTLVTRGVLWSVIYLGAVVAPLFFMLIGDAPPGRGWWTDLSLALGFIGLAMLGLQFAVTARFHPVDAPYGLDAVLQYHRQISFLAFAFVLAHPAILIIERPGRLDMLNPLAASTVERWGLVSVVALVVLIAASVWRRQLRLRYELWRVSHGLLAIVVVASALIHIERSGYYVSEPWSRVLWILMSVVLIGLLGYVRVIKPWLLLRRPYTVTAVRPVAPRTWALTLQAEGHAGVRFQPGQFAWLTIDRTPFAVREHPFSFSSSAEQIGTYEFTIKELGDFTSQIGEVEPATRAYLDGPYGAFSTERYQGPGYVLIAGGVGISPMMSMLRTFADLGDRRPVTLIYGSPSFEEAIYREALDALGQRLNLEIVHVLEEAPGNWSGETGLITGEMLDRHLPERAERRQFFICGPDPMMDAVERLLRERGIPADNIQLERFEFV
jgi:predicted ferric reductase